MQILNSATKIVLIIMTLAFIGLTYTGKVEGKDFFNAMLMIFAFYFGQKTNVPVQEVQAPVDETKG
jgi:hypothetical protein